MEEPSKKTTGLEETPDSLDELLRAVAYAPIVTPSDDRAPPDVEDPLLGKTLGHFRVTQRLGAGGMGIVYSR